MLNENITADVMVMGES